MTTVEETIHELNLEWIAEDRLDHQGFERASDCGSI